MITSRNAHKFALAFLAASALTGTTLAGAAKAEQRPTARPVTLAQSTVPADFLSNLGPGASIDAADEYGYNCAENGKGYGYFSDTSAYTFNGGALTGQQWSKDGLLSFWYTKSPKGRPGTHHGRVSFDGRTFRNTTSSWVIVAGWCG